MNFWLPWKKQKIPFFYQEKPSDLSAALRWRKDGSKGLHDVSSLQSNVMLIAKESLWWGKVQAVWAVPGVIFGLSGLWTETHHQPVLLQQERSPCDRLWNASQLPCLVWSVGRSVPLLTGKLLLTVTVPWKLSLRVEMYRVCLLDECMGAARVCCKWKAHLCLYGTQICLIKSLLVTGHYLSHKCHCTDFFFLCPSSERLSVLSDCAACLDTFACYSYWLPKYPLSKIF